MAEQELLQQIKVLEEVEKIYPDMKSSVIRTFLMVCVNESITITELANALGIPQPRISKYLSLLSDRHHKLQRYEPGYDLLITKTDSEVRTKKRVYLTSKGKTLRNRIVKILGKLSV
jgi:DNA-binding MarR family transcriptional regulator